MYRLLTRPLRAWRPDWVRRRAARPEGYRPGGARAGVGRARPVALGLSTLFLALLLSPTLAGAAPALRIMPPNQSNFAVGQRFDLRVEASSIPAGSGQLQVTLNGVPLEEIPGAQVVRTSATAARQEVTVRDLSFDQAMDGVIEAVLPLADGSLTQRNTFRVLETRGPAPRAKNIILMIGDGMGLPHRVAARVVARGLQDGRYNGRLEMDDMEYLAVASTSSLDALVTDSANGGTAYAGGNKTNNGALCVWPDNTSDPADNPRFENLLSYAKRVHGLATGVVTTAPVTDATPAAFLSYSYDRGATAKIAAQIPAAAPEVLLGGGRSAVGTAVREQLISQGYAYVTTAAELQALPTDTLRCLGLFCGDVMASYMDRLRAQQTGTGAVAQEPSLVQMTEAALAVLSRHPQGFVLMVEGASIDKQSHKADGSRVVWETIEFDRAVGVAKRFAEERGDTLVVVTADHETGGLDLTGLSGTPLKLQTSMGTVPALKGEGMLEPEYVAPKSGSLNHTAVDVPVSASGVGASQFRGSVDATDVFFFMVRALGGGYEPPAKDSMRGDVDGDGKLGVQDAVMLLRALVGLQSL